jgi:S-formylglutathione hydrolase FrmB
MANQGIGSSTTDVDTITVELRNANTFALVASTDAILKTDGNAICSYSTSQIGSFYIAVKHRNAVQTWSLVPITFGVSPVSYDFTDFASKAYGANMSQVEPNVWALYSGDLNQDETVDNFDADSLFFDIENSAYGYFDTDINGDGSVDNFDADSFFINIENSVFSNHPQ